jgi:hypothetical protein
MSRHASKVPMHQNDNGAMHPMPAALLLVVCLAACSPTFNWREVRLETAGLKALLPCKPDKGARQVPMTGRQVSLEALGCDTGGATFAVLVADIGDATRSGEALAQWKADTSARLRAGRGAESPFNPPGGRALPESRRVVTQGQRGDGSKVVSHAAYFARGSHVFQAAIYADQLKPEVADAFFSGLRFE